MQSLVRTAFALFIALALALALALPASAQTYPARNITLVVGYAPGGTGDFVARLVGNKLSEKYGRTVVVENRAGASGAIAAQFVANAPPDGYTILCGQTPEIAINPHTYKGAGPALADLLGSHVDFYFPGFPAALPFVKNGQMKLLAVSTAQRAATAPDVPTVAEAAGIKDFDFSLWAGFFAPRNTPKAIVAQLNGAINEVLALPDIKAKMADAGTDIIAMSPDAFAAFIKRESEKYMRVTKEAGIKPE